jgi:hypothetical protein
MRDFRKELVVKREHRRAEVGRLTDDCVQGRLLGADDRREKRREDRETEEKRGATRTWI